MRSKDLCFVLEKGNENFRNTETWNESSYFKVEVFLDNE